MTERVVITGAGIISCLGNDTAAVRDALHGRSGISLRQDHIDAGMLPYCRHAANRPVRAHRSQAVAFHGRCCRLRLPQPAAGDCSGRPD